MGNHGSDFRSDVHDSGPPSLCNADVIPNRRLNYKRAFSSVPICDDSLSYVQKYDKKAGWGTPVFKYAALFTGHGNCVERHLIVFVLFKNSAGTQRTDILQSGIVRTKNRTGGLIPGVKG